jgi:hypothetical protein
MTPARNTSRDSTADTYSLWVQPASRAWSASRAALSRMRGALSAVAYSICLRASVGMAIRPPPLRRVRDCRRCRLAGGVGVDAEAGVVVGQVAHQPGLVSGLTGADARACWLAGPELGSCGDMAGSVMVWRRAQLRG